MTLDVCPIFTRVLTHGSVPLGMLKLAARMLGFFSTISAIDSVFGILLAMVKGTTAPFSAMSGEVMVMSLLSVGAAPPIAFTASLSDLVSNAALFQPCAEALADLKRPAAKARPSTAAPPEPFSTFLRPLFMVAPCIVALNASQKLYSLTGPTPIRPTRRHRFRQGRDWAASAADPRRPSRRGGLFPPIARPRRPAPCSARRCP